MMRKDLVLVLDVYGDGFMEEMKGGRWKVEGGI